MIGAAGPRPIPSGLAARIIGFLSVALIPLGAVAYLQTTELDQETRARTELSLVTLTETSASGERDSILRALGNAQALGATINASDLGPEACTAALRGYINATSQYSFVGVLPLSGVMECDSAGRFLDLRDAPGLAERMSAPQPLVSRSNNPVVSKEPVLVVSEPFFQMGKFAGYITLSLPASGLRQGNLPTLDDEVEELVTFNHLGSVLSSQSPLAEAESLLPETLSLRTLVDVDGHSFRARSRDGTVRVFAVAPLVPDLVYALSIWPEDSRASGAVTSNRAGQILPFLMWAASVVVAFLAINRLVIRHIKTLSQQMRAFARTRRVPEPSLTDNMALELRDMESDFQYMANAILQDEAQLENALREKTILLKEVHHRVKNNLQLISSIMNMQIRQSREDETRDVLRRLQERIRGLATIHRNLYMTEDLGHVNAGQLLEDLIRQMAVVAEKPGYRVKLETNLESIEVYPDQAVPLSLLTAEALTNAGKYMVADETGVAQLKVTFRRTSDRRAEIEIVNSCRPSRGEVSVMSGLGERLIRAFASQLGGELTQKAENGMYRVHVDFGLSDFKPEVVDY